MAHPPSSPTGLILAGGKSSRMGTDKALLTLGGETLLARAERLLAACGVRHIHILGRPDLPGGTADTAPFAGPATALRGWLATHPDAGQILVLPVDMPCLTPELLKPLMVAGAARYGDYYLPFTAKPPRTALPATSRLRDLQEGLGVRSLPVPEGTDPAFANVNTPADLEALRPGLGS